MRWKIKELLEVSTKYLKDKGIESPRLTAELLLSHALGLDRISLYLRFDQPLTDPELSSYRGLITRRIRREPLQYITGIKEFWSLEFAVDPRGLIPRPETEALVEKAVAILKEKRKMDSREPLVLDMCTGCGAIAVAISKEIPEARIWATDVSKEVLKLARLNAERHGVTPRIEFRQGDLWEALPTPPLPKFDLIVSNPPYVPTEEFEALPPEVRDYEPRLALDGGTGGTRILTRILKAAPDYMSPGGWIMVELDPRQVDNMVRLAEETGRYGEVRPEKDFSGRNRFITARGLN